MRCLNELCQRPFKPLRDGAVYCSERCKRPGALPGMPPKEEAGMLRRCKSLMLDPEGYPHSAIVERFGSSTYKRVWASLSAEEKRKAHGISRTKGKEL